MHQTPRDRRLGARDRYAQSSARGPKCQIAMLDERLGEGVGATKERARLARLFEERQRLEMKAK